MNTVIACLRGICKILYTFLSTRNKRPLESDTTPSGTVRDFNRYRVSESFPEIALNMIMDPQSFNNLYKVDEMREVTEFRWGRLEILSGFRSKELNRKIGGSKTSDHCIGAAFDFYCPEVPTDTIFKWIIKRALPYRQVIYYPEQNFIHISVNTDNKKFKMEALIKRGGKYYEI